MRVLQTDFWGDHNLGLFTKTSDKICLAGNKVSGKRIVNIEKALGVNLINTSVANTELIGIFCAINSNGILLPKIVNENELKSFEGLAKENGLNVGIIGSRFTAIGNLVLCNDKGALISRLFGSKDKKTIRDSLDVEPDYGTVAGLNNVGSCGIATNKGCLLHRDASEKELDSVQELLRVETDIGTANFGSPFVGSCAIANSRGIVAGENTTGPEITRMMEALSLL